MKTTLTLLTLIILTISTNVFALKPAPWVGNNLKGEMCTGEKGYGPYDYVKDREKVHLVEEYHFTPQVEALIKGQSGSIEGDLNYTLRAFPNHHKALLSIIRFKLNILKGLRKEKLQTEPECYLNRAIEYSPDDPAPFSLYAYYLSKVGENERAKDLYNRATQIDPENMKIKYSYALFLLDNNDKEKAYELAQEIYEKEKSAPPGLRDQLKKAGMWDK